MNGRWNKLNILCYLRTKRCGKYMDLIEMKYKVIWRNICEIYSSRISPSILTTVNP